MLKRLLLKWKNIVVKNNYELKTTNYESKNYQLSIVNYQLFYIFAHQRHRGRAARHRSAKPSTPVRIRTMPQKPSKKFGGFLILNCRKN